MSEKEVKNVENTLLSKTKKVAIGDKKIEIKALVRAEYKPLMGMFAEVLMSFDLEILDNIEENVGTLINIISESALIELYKSHTGKDTEWLNNNLTMNQEMELFQAICEVNDINQMVENFTKTLQAMKVIQIAKQKQN